MQFQGVCLLGNPLLAGRDGFSWCWMVLNNGILIWDYHGIFHTFFNDGEPTWIWICGFYFSPLIREQTLLSVLVAGLKKNTDQISGVNHQVDTSVYPGVLIVQKWKSGLLWSTPGWIQHVYLDIYTHKYIVCIYIYIVYIYIYILCIYIYILCIYIYIVYIYIYVYLEISLFLIPLLHILAFLLQMIFFETMMG